jgi:hypothetical protein
LVAALYFSLIIKSSPTPQLANIGKALPARQRIKTKGDNMEVGIIAVIDKGRGGRDGAKSTPTKRHFQNY